MEKGGALEAIQAQDAEVVARLQIAQEDGDANIMQYILNVSKKKI